MTTTKAPDPMALAQVIVARVNLTIESRQWLKIGLTIDDMMAMTPHRLFATLFVNNQETEKPFDRIETLGEANRLRAKKGLYPVIPHWLWTDK